MKNPKKTEKKQSKPTIVRESNRLIEAKYKLDVWESRIFLAALSQVKPQDEGFKKYKIYIKDFEREFGIGDKDVYTRVRKAAQSMRRKEIKIPYEYEEGMGYLVTGLFTSYGGMTDGDGAFVVAELHPDLKPYLLQLKEQFTQYNIAFLMKMRSGHSRRIYRLLKQYQSIGKRELTVVHLRELLCIDKDEYTRYSNFKKRIILGAQKDLEKHTDLKFTFKEVKKGRKVHSIIFSILDNKTNLPPVLNLNIEEVLSSDDTIEEEPNEFFEEIFPKVKDWVSKATLSQWISNYPKEQIQNGVTYTLRKLASGEKIDNVGGYLAAMVKQENLIDKTEVEQERKAELKKKQIELTKRKAELVNREKEVRSELKQKEDFMIEAIFMEDPDARQEIISGLKQNIRFGKFDPNKSDEENLSNPMIAAAFRNNILKAYEGRFKKLHERYSSKIAEIKNQLKRL